MITATISEAKNHLADLVRKAQSGETVVITSGPEETPVATLQAIAPAEIVPAVTKRLGILETPGFILTDAFFDPLPEDERVL